MAAPGPYPGGKRFAFSIIDDTDDATAENIRPIYALLDQLGMRLTKTVWPVDCPEGSAIFHAGHTLANPEYLEFVRSLSDRGVELAFHGATMESSPRARVETALERFREIVGTWPRIHANHAQNRDNVYWGVDRVDQPAVRMFYGLNVGVPKTWFQGHCEGSSWWWGDLCRERIDYVRNLTFDEVNLLRVNPSMPYQDPRRPWVRWWFSATDAEDAAAFNDILNEPAQDRLEEEGGVCIIATHLGKRYTRAGRVHPRTEALLRSLASRAGWFPTVSVLLDWLKTRRATTELPTREWRAMQWRWARDLVRRRLRRIPPLRWPD